MSVIHKIDQTGDTQVAWDVADLDSVELARAFFQKAVSQEGYWAAAEYEGQPGSKVAITEFDETATRIHLAPRLVGG